MKRALLILAMLFAALSLGAQTTKVRGVVTDAETGEPIPFAGIFFKGTTIGLTADIDGKYTLETRDPAAKILVCQLLGYDVQEVPVKQGAFTEVNFKLKLTDNQLSGAFVKADNRLIKRLLRNIDAHRDRNDPDRRPYYKCKVYNKMELDLTHPREQLRSKAFLREFGFVFDYIDTSVVSGVPYLPAMISESVVERRHSDSPDIDNETVLANRISGINPDHNMLSQFTGSMHLRVNFYRPFINSFDVEFPSPIQNSGLLYYNYFIVDSLQVDGRKTYVVRYHPKKGISTPALDGEMRIDAEEFALKSIKAKMVKGGNVNWLRDIVLETDYQRLPDSTWFYKQDKLYADFSIALGDSSRVMSVIGTRQLNYSDLDFSPIAIEDMQAGEGKVKVLEEANHRDEAFWQEARPYELTRKEQDIYKMVDQIQDAPLYKNAYTIIYTLVTEYWDIGPIGIGPYIQLISNNSLEGFKPRLGIHTSKELSKKFRWTGFLAYGFRDKQFKGGLTYEHLFNKEPFRKLTLDASYDVFQLGKGSSNLTSGNLLASIWGGTSRLAPRSNFSAFYEHEFSMNFNAYAEVALRRYFSNAFVPMDTWETVDGRPVSHPSVATNELRLQARFSREETVNRGYFVKSYVHTFHPVWTIDLSGSIPGIRKGDVGYFKPQLYVDWKFRIPPFGMSDMHFNAGAIIGQVPWPMLNLFPGNATNILDKSAFSCMEYFEFASDRWASLIWYHNLNGFILGKIPLLRKLQLREEFSAKIAYGMLSDANNGTDPSYGALTRFPTHVYPQRGGGAFTYTTQPMGGVPYVELGIGVSNIFRLLRVDYVRRITHTKVSGPDGTMVPARRLWTINVGMELRF